MPKTDAFNVRVYTFTHQTIIITCLLLALIFHINTARADPVADFTEVIKQQLPKHQQFESLEMQNIEKKGNAAVSMMQAELLIKVRAKENLYRIKSYKNGKYELVLSVKKGDVSERKGTGITLPAMAKMGKVRVMMMPDNSASAEPLSKYKKGTYTIVTADAPALATTAPSSTANTNKSAGRAVATTITTPPAPLPVKPVKKTVVVQKLAKKSKPRMTPWTTAKGRSAYIQSGNSLWNIDSMKEVNGKWFPRPVVQIEGLNDRFLLLDMPYDLMSIPYGAYRGSLSTSEPKGRVSVTPVALSNAWISRDLKHVVQFKDGDVWHGDIDWKAATVKNQKNVTRLGILNDLTLISWYKNTIYARRPAGGEKPVLRINLQTGDLLEMEDNPVFMQTQQQGSPDGRFLFSAANQHGQPTIKLTVYDAQKQIFFSMPAGFNRRRYGGELDEEDEAIVINARDWLDAHTFSTPHGWYDLNSRSRMMFTDISQITRDIPAMTRIIAVFRMPDADYVEVVAQGSALSDTGTAARNSNKTKRFIVNRKTGTATEVPVKVKESYNQNQNILTWLDTHRYVYSQGGGLNDVGTWLFDINTGKKKRLTAISPDVNTYAYNWSFKAGQYNSNMINVYHQDKILNLAERNEVAFCARRGKKYDLVIISLSSGKQRRAEIKAGNMGCRLNTMFPASIKVN